MEIIRNAQLLQSLLEQEKILSHFETEGLLFHLRKYEKQELLCAPGSPLTNLLFPVKGSVRVYGLRKDGSSFSVSRGVGQTTLGTMEFVRNDLPVFYTEAEEEVLCIALPIGKNRPALEQDRVFLRYVLNSMVDIILMFTLIGSAGQPVEEKVLTFLRDIQPDHTLHSISAGLAQLHCSRRQLQRVVKKLCEDGALEKIGKGKYRLVKRL